MAPVSAGSRADGNRLPQTMDRMNPPLPLLADRLSQALSASLPGFEIQRTMAPSVRRNNPMAEPRPLRRAAVLFLLYARGRVPHLPFIVRPEYDGPHSGQIALPGGKREEGDGSLWDTAIRETEEEVGVPRADIHFIGCLTKVYIPNSHYLVSPYVGWIEHRAEFAPHPQEVHQVLEVAVERLLAPERVHREIWNIRGLEVDVPFYACQGHKIWGATAMMLAELLHCMSHLPPS